MPPVDYPGQTGVPTLAPLLQGRKSFANDGLVVMEEAGSQRHAGRKSHQEGDDTHYQPPATQTDANIKARRTVVLVADLQQVQMKWGSAFLFGRRDTSAPCQQCAIVSDCYPEGTALQATLR
jgi:hypothetical protein